MILDDFESFIKFRIGTGYAGYAMNYAKRYAQFLYSNYGNEEEVTEEMLQEYLKLHPHNNHNTYANAIAEIRTFSKYINQTGRKAYIPDKDYTYWKKRTEFIPYLLNDKELKMFFDHLDSYSDKDLYERRANRKVVFPILYRMMYCCGMRPQEVLNLKTIDVDLAFGDIYIRKTKSYFYLLKCV